MHLFVINLQALPPALRRIPSQQRVENLVPERPETGSQQETEYRSPAAAGLASLRPSPLSGAAHRAASPSLPPGRSPGGTDSGQG